MRTLTRFGAGVLALSMAMGVAACGDDSDDDAADDEMTTTTEAEEAAEPITVTAVDYRFEGLPEEIEAGTKLQLVNQSAGELHELVVIRIPDGEDRSVADLVALPEEESDAIFGDVEPATVLLAPPSSTEQIPAVGDGTIAEPGRYAVVCFIPTGADPDAYLNAPPSDGPPQVEGGPPHAAQGMFAELTVT